jgi:hypothetical protein
MIITICLILPRSVALVTGTVVQEGGGDADGDDDDDDEEEDGDEDVHAVATSARATRPAIIRPRGQALLAWACRIRIVM